MNRQEQKVGDAIALAFEKFSPFPMTSEEKLAVARAAIKAMTPEDVAADFEDFWRVWPNKVGKPVAQKAYAAARRRGNGHQTIMDGADAYYRTKPAERPWLNPATFLNQDRFNDAPAPVQGKAPRGADVFFDIAEASANERAARGPDPFDRPDVRGLPQRPGWDHQGDGRSLSHRR